MFSGSEGYERLMGRWSRRLAPRLVEFAGVRDGQRVLDVGCGTGSVAQAVAAAMRGGEIVGIDPAAAYVEQARKASADARLSFQVGDALALPFPNDNFDCSLSCLALNFMPDAPKAAREMARVVRSGGVVAACVWDYGEGMEMLRVFWDAVVELDAAAEPCDERHMPYCRKGELGALWKEAGMGAVEEAALEVRCEFASFDDFWEPFLSGQGPSGAYATKLPGERQARLRERLRERLLGGRADGSITLPCRAWAVKGRPKTSGTADERR